MPRHWDLSSNEFWLSSGLWLHTIIRPLEHTVSAQQIEGYIAAPKYVESVFAMHTIPLWMAVASYNDCHTSWFVSQSDNLMCNASPSKLEQQRVLVELWAVAAHNNQTARAHSKCTGNRVLYSSSQVCRVGFCNAHYTTMADSGFV